MLWVYLLYWYDERESCQVALSGDALKTYEKRQLSLVYIQNEDGDRGQYVFESNCFYSTVKQR